jgi:hypothetical protein
MIRNILQIFFGAFLRLIHTETPKRSIRNFPAEALQLMF